MGNEQSIGLEPFRYEIFKPFKPIADKVEVAQPQKPSIAEVVRDLQAKMATKIGAGVEVDVTGTDTVYLVRMIVPNQDSDRKPGIYGAFVRDYADPEAAKLLMDSYAKLQEKAQQNSNT